MPTTMILRHPGPPQTKNARMHMPNGTCSIKSSCGHYPAQHLMQASGLTAMDLNSGITFLLHDNLFCTHIMQCHNVQCDVLSNYSRQDAKHIRQTFMGNMLIQHHRQNPSRNAAPFRLLVVG
eukprot:4502401-Amphidinium_carterae.1